MFEVALELLRPSDVIRYRAIRLYRRAVVVAFARQVMAAWCFRTHITCTGDAASFSVRVAASPGSKQHACQSASLHVLRLDINLISLEHAAYQPVLHDMKLLANEALADSRRGGRF